MKRMDVLDGASVSAGWLFSQLPGEGRHMDGVCLTGFGPECGSRRVGWFLCKMGMGNFGSSFAWLRAREGRSVDALAPGGDEGRGTLRKAMGSREQALIHGYPNGATHPSDRVSRSEYIGS